MAAMDAAHRSRRHDHGGAATPPGHDHPQHSQASPTVPADEAGQHPPRTRTAEAAPSRHEAHVEHSSHDGHGGHEEHDGHGRSEEHTSELQSRGHLVCRLLLEKKKLTDNTSLYHR